MGFSLLREYNAENVQKIAKDANAAFQTRIITCIHKDTFPSQFSKPILHFILNMEIYHEWILIPDIVWLMCLYD